MQRRRYWIMIGALAMAAIGAAVWTVARVEDAKAAGRAQALGVRVARMRSGYDVTLRGVNDVQAAVTAVGAMGPLVRVDATGIPLADLDLRSIARHSELRMLQLGGSRVNGAFLGWLPAKTQLHDVVLNDTLLDDRHVCGPIAKLHLQLLDISGTKVTDSGVRCILQQGLGEDLIALKLARTSVTSAVAEAIGRCPLLEGLDVSWTQLDDKAAEELIKLPRLRSIRVAGTRMGNRGIEVLASAGHVRQHLEILDVSETAIDDEAVGAMGQLHALQAVRLSWTPITPAGVEALLRTLKPNVLQVGRNLVTPSLEAAVYRASPKTVLRGE